MNRRKFKQERDRINRVEGLSDIFKSMISSASKKMGSEATKKIVKSAADSAAKAAVKPIAKPTGEVIANKMFSKDEPKDDRKIDGGPMIEKELQKHIKTMIIMIKNMLKVVMFQKI